MQYTPISLNLEKDVLEGWEECYDVLNLKVLRLATELGHRLPPVDIVKEGNIYRLAFGQSLDPEEAQNFGGHTRSVLALQTASPLRCVLLDKHRADPSEHETPITYRPISQLKPRIKRNALSRVARNLRFLPHDTITRFLEENDLILINEETLIGGNN